MSAPLGAITPGTQVLVGIVVHDVVDFADLENVVLRDPAGQLVTVHVRDVKPLRQLKQSRTVDVAALDAVRWERALNAYSHVSHLLNLPEGERTRDEVAKAAELLCKHPSTIYRWIERYRLTGRVSAFLRARRTDQGQSKLSPAVEAIISRCIDEFFLTENRASMSAVALEVRRACKAANLPAPDASTVKSRIYRLDPTVAHAARFGNKSAESKMAPLRGSFPNADFPLAVVQMDHTPTDLILVDEFNRKPIGRADLTLAIDVNTKMVLGFFISLDKAGALATGQCLVHAILPKDDWLRSQGLDESWSWPCWGLMRTIHTDNAVEFRGTMLGAACKEYGIIAERRPGGQPRYGGHVERSFRTFMSRIHQDLDGTTFSSVAKKLDYDSEGKAVLDLPAFQRWFTMYITGRYHLEPHAGNDGLPPLVKWRRAHIEGDENTLPLGLPMRVPNEERLRLDFLPYFEATVQRYGIKSWSVEWYADSLRRLMHSRDPSDRSKSRKFICRYDARDLSRIWLYDDMANRYLEIPYRNRARPPASLWEIKAAKRRLREDSMATTNEELIFRTMEMMRQLVKEQARLTKSARRMQQRQRGWESARGKVDPKPAKLASKSSSPTPPKVEESVDFEPFPNIRES